MQNETQENQDNQETQENQNLAPTAEDLEAIKAQLQAECDALRAERSNLEQALAERDSKLAELESALSEAKAEVLSGAKELESTAAELAAATEAKNQAVAKYLNMAKALNPTIPEGIIAGDTIAEIDTSVEKGKAIVEAVKKAMESEAAATKVPAGAPTRGGIDFEGMSPREKIAYAIQQKGGT